MVGLKTAKRQAPSKKAGWASQVESLQSSWANKIGMDSIFASCQRSVLVSGSELLYFVSLNRLLRLVV